MKKKKGQSAGTFGIVRLFSLFLLIFNKKAAPNEVWGCFVGRTGLEPVTTKANPAF